MSFIALVTCTYYNSKERSAFFGNQIAPVYGLLNDPEMDIERYGHLILEEVIKTKPDVYYRIVALLLESDRIDLSKLNTADLLISAAEKGHVSVLRILLNDDRFDPSANDNSALRSSVERGQYGSVFSLMRDGRCKPDVSMLKQAVANKNFGIIEDLLLDRELLSYYVEKSYHLF